MQNLVLPNSVAIQLIDSDKRPLRMRNVLFRLCLLARYKNDYTLGPFATNNNGVCTISRNEIDAGVADELDFDLMGHRSVDECSPSVKICIFSVQDIHRAIEARTKVWTLLAKGERTRWKTLEQLMDAYRGAGNGLLVDDPLPTLRDDWLEAGANYHYELAVQLR